VQLRISAPSEKGDRNRSADENARLVTGLPQHSALCLMGETEKTQDGRSGFGRPRQMTEVRSYPERLSFLELWLKGEMRKRRKLKVL